MEWQKGPVIYGFEWIGDKLKNSMADLVFEYISAMPIMLGVAFGVYALGNMISSKLAKYGSAGVFVYGALITVASS